MMKFIKRNWRKIVLSLYAVFSPTTMIFASCDPGKQICNPIDPIDSIPGFIQTLLDGAIKVGLPVIVLAVIYCGFLFVKAQGKPEEITKAKDALLYTVIGAAILLGSYAIAQLIQSTVTGLAS